MNDLISRAERFARVCHEGQFRKGKAKEPYTIHLEEVANLTRTLGGRRQCHRGRLATRYGRRLSANIVS